MFSKLSYRQKLKGTGFLALLALVLCYRLSISRTLEEYRKYHEEKTTTTDLSPESASFTGLQTREERVSGLFSRYMLDTLQPERNLLAVVSNYCKEHNLSLKEYKPSVISGVDSIPVLTRTVVVGGPFIPCLRLLYSLESLGQTGRVSSVEFRGYTDIQDKKPKMDCTIYIQNLIPTDHEAH